MSDADDASAAAPIPSTRKRVRIGACRAFHDIHAANARGLLMRDGDSAPVPKRALAFVAVGWTIACGAWVASSALEGKLDTGPIAVAVIGFIGIIWFVGMLILSLFWIGGPPDGS